VTRVAWWLGWWVVLFWLWLAFAGEWNSTEWEAAALAATVAASIAEIVRAQGELRFRFRLPWLREAAVVPLVIVEDCAIVLWSLRHGRRHEGVFTTRATGPRGRAAEAAGRSAFLAYAATFSPNAYVVDVDRETGDVVLHDLVERRRSEEPA
jgi:hypothetical protein